jgi:sodium transport system ATP-binding protein
MNGTNEILRVNGLSKTFKLSARQQRIEHTRQSERIAVENLSFTVNSGEIFGILGPNGAGKTTTLRMLATLIKPSSGDALLGGFSIVEQPERVRGLIGFLTSELNLEATFTPNYLFDFFSALYGIEPAVAARRKQQLFERFAIDRFAEVKVADLSTGMAQKLSIAISVVHDPDVIIFDEPTNGLDVLTARVVTNYLEELRAAGKTIILSTHIFSLVEKLCDRIGVIIDGRMVACDTLPNIMRGISLEDRFFELYSEQKAEVA